jgi:hypothetical protein
MSNSTTTTMTAVPEGETRTTAADYLAEIPEQLFYRPDGRLADYSEGPFGTSWYSGLTLALPAAGFNSIIELGDSRATQAMAYKLARDSATAVRWPEIRYALLVFLSFGEHPVVIYFQSIGDLLRGLRSDLMPLIEAMWRSEDRARTAPLDAPDFGFAKELAEHRKRWSARMEEK